MNYKEPRDPNTPSCVLKLRDIPEGEYWPCHVGSGECKNPAIESHDNGNGGEFLVCKEHLPEVHAFGKLINEMSLNELKNFESIINDSE